MSDGGEEPEREIPLRITNVELSKLVKEQMTKSRMVQEENRTMKRELDRLKNNMRKESDDESKPQEIGGDEEQENIPTDHRPFLAALERVGKKGEGDLPTFYGKLDPNVCMDQIEALDNHFEFDKTSEKSQGQDFQGKTQRPYLELVDFFCKMKDWMRARSIFLHGRR